MRDLTDVYCISTGRSKAVQSIQNFFGPNVTWVVKAPDVDGYVSAGASKVEVSDSLCSARNFALVESRKKSLHCVQISDDLKSLKRLGSDKKGQAISGEDALEILFKAALETRAKLVGCAPTANPFYASEKIQTRHFILGDLFWCHKDSDVLFDEGLPLKEDYDFTCAHLARYGFVARCDYLLADFAHRTNVGGAVDYRTVELEQKAIAMLKFKWGLAIRDNPRRPNEILLKWPK